MSEYSTTTLTMKRHFNVSSERVYDAWLNPEMMKKWLFTLEATNQKAANDPHEGGTWEIIDRREGKDYRAIGDYLVIDRPKKLLFTFKMPQFSETVDHITVVFEPVGNGCDMTFSQEIIVPHEENWTEENIEKALTEFHDGSEHGWNLMFIGLKQLVEEGFISFEKDV
ncbi:SRPBCC family protein [Shouchella patagoniensis]|uniref:SRPBCC family protein n=1 Tax=Shouchella patagoniensis TaxID=228576 RepID=UPI00099558C6|nr:SRPBCC domain-containing protein [Shouchella patagoniensis]